MPPGKLSRAYSKAAQVGIAPGQAGAPGLMGFGQGALGFHPTDLPNVVFGWTTESLGPLADGTQIASILPVVSNRPPASNPLLQATPAARPLFKNNARNGYPALQLDGTQYILQTTNDVTTAMGYSAQYFTLVTVCMSTLTDDNLDHWAWGLLTGTDTAIDVNWNSTSDTYLISSGAGMPNGSAIGDQNKWHIMGGSLSAGYGDRSIFRIDGVQYEGVSNATYIPPQSNPLAANGFTAGIGSRSGGRIWAGFIAEGWLFNGGLSLPDWKRLEQYFSRKYNITVAG